MATTGNPVSTVVNGAKKAANVILNPIGNALSTVNSATGNKAGQAATAAANAAGQATGLGAIGSDISSVTGFASALGNKTLWLRVAKVTIGGALLIVGVAHITGADGKIAHAAYKYAPLL